MYIHIKQWEKKTSLSPRQYSIHRYVRLEKKQSRAQNTIRMAAEEQLYEHSPHTVGEENAPQPAPEQYPQVL